MIVAFMTTQVYVHLPMSNNLQPIAGHDFALPAHTVLCLHGADAMAFAQAQFMNDVGRLTDGQWQWNGWLTPKGRLIALFALLRLDPETLWLLLLPGTDAATLAQALQRYVLRRKVTIAPQSLPVSARFSAPQDARDATLAQIGDGVIELDMSGDGGPRRLLIGATGLCDAQAEAAWARADMTHGLPWLSEAQAGQWTPQQLSLQRLNAFSVKKGCYPGQEIVARTHFLGQSKRGLVLLETDSPIAVGAPVQAAGETIGQIIATAAPLALAVLPHDAPLALHSADGHPLQRRALAAGLVRG
ncbi:hypothetical protein SAMN02745204_00958 [Thermomonas hydrothermalis]|uniref:Aminomethyltransferase folate-binding domain-containing protein n=2 Tax=Thermomonas hydrothermalis TaxID=213588 RepID=A0A1M4VJU5_9GAMM|nr:hypothetical protein SAMN02745204_00958 [Thermomonas hydrothermalis]